MNLLPMILASSLALSAAAEPLLDCPGLVTDKTPGFYSRDYVHSGELGKQVVGRVLLACFTAREGGRP